jgi:predicted CXXCH cytochrome family protein
MVSGSLAAWLSDTAAQFGEYMHISKKTRLSILTLGLVAMIVVFTGCAPRQASPEANEPEPTEELVAVTWDMQSECAVCHSSAEESRFETADLASNDEHATSDCITCHDDETGLSSAHSGATAPPEREITRLRKSKVSSETCLSCHESREELAQVTAASVVLTDKEGNVINPHDLPASEDHENNANCGSCHIMHKPAALEEDAVKVCVSCHHQEVFVACEVCHGPAGV